MDEKITKAGQPGKTTSEVAQPRILVIGLGNPILGDDGIGWHVAEAVQKMLQSKDFSAPEQIPSSINSSLRSQEQVEFEFLSLGGLALMERMVGYTYALIIDAITTNNYPVGTVLSFSIDDLISPVTGHMASVHDTSLQNALQIGTMLGANLPHDIKIIGIEAQVRYDFSESLSETVSASIPTACQLSMEELAKWLQPEE